MAMALWRRASPSFSGRFGSCSADAAVRYLPLPSRSFASALWRGARIWSNAACDDGDPGITTAHAAL